MSPPTAFATLPDSLRYPARLLIALTAVGLAASPLPAAEITVPSDVATIQGAIDLAADGDTVVVSPGTYFETIDFLGKAIVVRSSAGADATVIDAGGLPTSWFATSLGIVVRFESGEGPESVLEGFTIRGGAGGWGGGITCHASSPTIRGNTIRDNFAVSYGGGIDCIDSEARIEGNTFIGNSARHYSQYPAGCGVFDCTTVYGGVGGGISVRGGAVTVEGCRFTNNDSGYLGGGVFIGSGGAAVLTSNIFEENSTIAGGAIACVGSGNVTIVNLLAHANVVTSNWGDPFDFSGDPTQAAAGAALYVNPVAGSTVSVSHATLVDNDSCAFICGGGEVIAPDQGPGSFVLRNSIVHQSSPLGSLPLLPAGIDVTYSNVLGGYPGVGNFDASPGFVAGPLGDHYLAQPAAGQDSLSPCVDAGDPADSAPDDGTTRTDHAADTGAPDLGYHYPGVGARFRRGDCNGDSAVDIADAIHLVSTIFPGNGGGGTFVCADACDTNDDGAIDIADAIATLGALFGNSPLPLPTPGTACGSDPTDDSLGCFIPSDC